MKFLVQLLCMFLMLMLISCSTVVERNPAQVDNEKFNYIFSIPLMDKELVPSKIKDLKDRFQYLGESFKYEIIESKNLEKGTAFKIELDIDPKTNKYVYRVFHSANAFKDYSASHAVNEFALKLLDTSPFNSRYSMFEAYYNAQHGDPLAQKIFFELREKTEFTEKADQEVLAEISKELKSANAKKNIDKEKRKAILNALDSAPDGKQFRTLVAKNDRNGAAGVLRKYLPWEEMAPFEKQFWENYLDIMINPVPLDQRIIIYRGLGGDYIHRGIVKGQELTEKEAIIEGNAFLMSTVLVKNQGSWNRRLRSIEAMNKKFIAQTLDTDKHSPAARITTMFVNHSASPEGSPFLSLSPSFNVAYGFSDQGYDEGKRVAAFALDPRLLNFNYASGFVSEYEYLASLTTFPDDLIAISDSKLMPENIDEAKIKSYFDFKLQEKVKRELDPAKVKDIVTKMKKNSYQFFKGEYKEVKNPAGANPAASNLKFFKKFIQADTPPVVLSPKGDLGCKDLIALFWTGN